MLTGEKVRNYPRGVMTMPQSFFSSRVLGHAHTHSQCQFESTVSGLNCVDHVGSLTTIPLAGLKEFCSLGKLMHTGSQWRTLRTKINSSRDGESGWI